MANELTPQYLFSLIEKNAGKIEALERGQARNARGLKDIEEEIKPYAGLKTLIIERDSRCPMPEFREVLKGII